MSVAESGPWCGTGRRPGIGGLKPGIGPKALALTHGEVEFDPQPDPPRWRTSDPQPNPWRIGGIAASLYAAIALSQAAQRLGGAEGGQIETFAQAMYDDYCGTVPFSELLWILLHIPPPPPDPWLREFLYAVDAMQFANALPAAQKEAFAGTAKKVISGAMAQS